jgi:signal transduction histidine kinase
MTGPPDPSLKQMRATIKRQTVHLTRIVDDLLDAGRIRSGKLDIEKTPGELNDIVRLALETSTPLMEQRRHRLNVTYAPAPIHFEVDAQRIVQVVCNLLNNAAKYSPRGSTIDVAVTVEQNDAVIHVRDSGIGIPPHMLERIFERFVQVKTGLRQAGGGLGIGLSLVRALVDLHGGTVTAESEGSGKGSLFTVRLPLRPGV